MITNNVLYPPGETQLAWSGLSSCCGHSWRQVGPDRPPVVDLFLSTGELSASCACWVCDFYIVGSMSLFQDDFDKTLESILFTSDGMLCIIF